MVSLEDFLLLDFISCLLLSVVLENYSIGIGEYGEREKLFLQTWC